MTKKNLIELEQTKVIKCNSTYKKLSIAILHEKVFNYVILNEDTIVHNKNLTIAIVYTV